MILRVLSGLLSILAPCSCVVCDRSVKRGFLCTRCADLSALEISLPNSCSVCAISYCEGESICPRCVASPLLVDGVRALVWYRDSAAWLIRAAKYRPSLALTRYAADLLAKSAPKLMRDLTPLELIVPLPASRSSLHTRGFNQSYVLALAVARSLQLPTSPAALKIRRKFIRRALIARNKRSLNFEGAFSACWRKVQGKRILLIDDVVTSGATAASATRALKRAGALSVHLLCFARAPGELDNLRKSVLLPLD